MADWISPDYPYKVYQVKGTSGGANGKLEYLFEAEPGTETSSALWRGRRFTYDSSGFLTRVEWASGDRKFDKIADNYASLSYS